MCLAPYRDCKDSTEEEEDVNPLQLKKKATRQLRKEKQVEGGSTSAVPGKGGGGEMEDVEELYDLASYDGQEEGEEEEEGHVESECAATVACTATYGDHSRACCKV